MIRKLKQKWKLLGLILFLCWINVYLYLRVPDDNISKLKSENITTKSSWKEINWMQKFKRLEASYMYMSKNKTFIGPGNAYMYESNI